MFQGMNDWRHLAFSSALPLCQCEAGLFLHKDEEIEATRQDFKEANKFSLILMRIPLKPFCELLKRIFLQGPPSIIFLFYLLEFQQLTPSDT